MVLGLGILHAQTQGLTPLQSSFIGSIIDSGRPFGVLYNGLTGHWILGIGYASAPGHAFLVVSNDPAGGVQRVQTYDNFITYHDGRPWAQTAR